MPEKKKMFGPAMRKVAELLQIIKEEPSEEFALKDTRNGSEDEYNHANQE